MFQQSRRTKSSNQMILSFQNWFAIYDFLHILRKLQILSISVVLTEQISSGADHFSYLVPWIPFTNLKFMRATDWFKNPRNFKWLIWFLPFLERMIFQSTQKKFVAPKKGPCKSHRKNEKKISSNPSTTDFPDFGLPSPCGLGMSTDRPILLRLACELDPGEVIGLRGKSFDVCGLCREAVWVDISCTGVRMASPIPAWDLGGSL